jgi:hypothetical protein
MIDRIGKEKQGKNKMDANKIRAIIFFASFERRIYRDGLLGFFFE